MTTTDPFPAPRKRPLPVALHRGRTYWRQQLNLRVGAVQRALDAGDDAGAERYLRRAQVCERALRGWDSVEAQGRRSGELSA